jgi:hypothetical protein
MPLSRSIRALVIGATVLAASAAHAQRTPVPIIDHPNVVVAAGSGKGVSQESLRQAIISGGASGPRKWTIVPAGDGKTLKGTYIVRAHTVVVDIVPGPGSYSLKYADSTNMKYGMDFGKPVIHPFYNDWVQQLVRAIDAEVKKL